MAFFSVVKMEIPLLEKSVFLTKKLHDVVLLWFSFFEVISTNQKAYLQLSRIPMIEFFAKTVDGVQPLFLYKRFIIAFRFMFYWVLNTLLLKPERCNIEFINCLFWPETSSEKIWSQLLYKPNSGIAYVVKEYFEKNDEKVKSVLLLIRRTERRCHNNV